jgi:hypothetical protein
MSAGGFNPYAYYDPSRDAMRGGWGNRENAAGRYERWLSDARNIAASRGYALTPDQQTALQRRGLGGIEWAEGPGGGGASGFNWGSYGPDVFANTYNPGEAIEHIVHGTIPQHAGVWGTPGQQGGTAPAPATTSMYDFLGRQLDPTQQLFYQTNPQLAYAYAGTRFSPNAASPRRDWWNQNWGQFNAEYANASVDNPNLQITDFLNQRFPQLAQAFDLLPAQMRGVNAPYLPAGRPQL